MPGILAWFGWLLRLDWLPLLLGAFAAVHGFWFLSTAVGRVDLRPDGIRLRRLVGITAIAWPDVSQCTVRRTPFGRHARVRHGQNRSLRLPAVASPYLFPDPKFDDKLATIRAACTAADAPNAVPVTGWGPGWAYPAVVAALVIGMTLPDRPWGWVAGAEATELADACSPVQTLVAAWDPNARAEPVPGVPTPGAESRACRWAIGSELVLIAIFQRYERYGLHSAASMAELDFGPHLPAHVLTFVDNAPHLGDESFVARYNELAGVALRGTIVAARRANVVVTVTLSQPDADPSGTTPDRTVAELDRLVEIARAALAAMTFR